MDFTPRQLPGSWRVPECAVAIEYSSEVMEAVRLAAVEAFYAFPRGGAEIGGLLFGSCSEGVVRISAHRPLECEHACGPSFVLSPTDLARLEELLAAGAGGLEPVGWYHSHTRSEIFLSPQDLEIHERFFGQPWQVALVLRPSSIETRAGFFARDASGELRAEASPLEFVIPAVAERPLRRPDPLPLEPPPPEPDAVPVVTQWEPPASLISPPRRRRAPWKVLVAVAVVVAAVSAAVATRETWMAWLPGASQPTVSLQAWDEGGTLQIRWDWRASPLRRARGGTLEIADGPVRFAFPLSGDRLKNGNFSYERRTERVEVRLRLEPPGALRNGEVTTFVGKAPASRPSPRELDLEKQLRETRTELIKEKMLTEALERTLKAGPEPPAAKKAQPARGSVQSSR